MTQTLTLDQGYNLAQMGKVLQHLVAAPYLSSFFNRGHFLCWPRSSSWQRGALLLAPHSCILPGLSPLLAGVMQDSVAHSSPTWSWGTARSIVTECVYNQVIKQSLHNMGDLYLLPLTVYIVDQHLLAKGIVLSYVAQLPCLNIENVEHAYILDICWLGDSLACGYTWPLPSNETWAKSSVKMEVLYVNASMKNDGSKLKCFV